MLNTHLDPRQTLNTWRSRGNHLFELALHSAHLGHLFAVVPTLGLARLSLLGLSGVADTVPAYQIHPA